MMKKKLNNRKLKEHFGSHTPCFLMKVLYKADQAKNQQILNQISDALIDLLNVTKMAIPENENPDRAIDIV